MGYSAKNREKIVERHEPFSPFRSLVRTVHLAIFFLLEYIRSARIIGDIVAAGIFFYIFFWARWGGGVDAEHFFSLTGIFLMTMTLYTTSAMLSLADKPPCYLLLSRRVGRAGYVVGILLSAMALLTTSYVVLSVAAVIFNGITDLSIAAWLWGTLPLLCDIALLIALLIMLSPLVLTTMWRLFVLTLIAIAFSDSFFTSPTLDTLPTTLRNVLAGLQALLSYPLVPAFSGFALAIHHEFSMYGMMVFIAQLSLLVAVVGVAIFAFTRREIIFLNE